MMKGKVVLGRQKNNKSRLGEATAEPNNLTPKNL